MIRAISLSSSYLTVYQNESGNNINARIPPKKMQHGNVLLELPMLGCRVKIELKSEGHFTWNKNHIISIISYNGDCVELLFYGPREGDNAQFHEWIHHIVESEKRSESNMPRLMEIRHLISPQVKSTGSRRPEVMRKSSVPFTQCPTMLHEDPISFVDIQPGNCNILRTLYS